MITAIQDNYYDFAPKLQEKLNEEFGAFFTVCQTFFEEQAHVSKNFAAYIRGTDPLHASKNEYHYIVELDNYTLLDVYGVYDPKTNQLSESHFRATLPYHETWNSEHFTEVAFSEAERAALVQKQQAFVETAKKHGVFTLFDILEFNPDRDTLPEALVEFRLPTSLADFVKTKEVFAFMNAYYAYCFSMKQLFEEKLTTKKA